MTDTYKTPQEQFWNGEFGDEYARRNAGASWIAANTYLFSKVISATRSIKSVLELGSNTGLNLRAIKSLIPEASLNAVEINEHAVKQLREYEGVDEVFHNSLLTFKTDTTYDLVFTKGVLIHINPEELNTVYDLLYSASNRYVLVSEYYNPIPVAIPYRGHTDRLFKRDFAGDLIERFPDLKLIDYGFIYRRDPNFPQDDATWFLMEKAGSG